MRKESIKKVENQNVFDQLAESVTSYYPRYNFYVIY